MEEIQSILGNDAYTLLSQAGICSINKFIQTPINELQDITKLPSSVCKEALQSASKEVLKDKIIRACDMPAIHRIKTGCKSIDDILSGGIPVSGIAEIYGCSGVGKTQLCLQLALNVQLPIEAGGEGGKGVIYIATEDVFPSKRLQQLSDAYRRKYNTDLMFEDNIYLHHIAESAQLVKCLKQEVPVLMKLKNIGFIIIDSIAGIFRSNNEKASYVARSREFRLIGKLLNQYQDQYNCAILTVNQVAEDLAAHITVPALGQAWSNNITCRFCLSRQEHNTNRRFDVIFAPDLPPKHVNVMITSEGLLDSPNN